WRLCTFSEADNEYTELLVRIQGILVKSTLIPSAETLTKMAPTKRIYLSQGAVIAGYGSSSFARSIRNTQAVHSLFERHLPPGSMADWTSPVIADFDIFCASTRLFTKKSYGTAYADQPFGEGVDSTQRLEQMKTLDLVHLTENKVTYMKRVVNKTTKKSKYEETTPAIFRIGDIVEMEVYFVAFLRSDKRVKMGMRLQGITLLESAFSKAGATIIQLALINFFFFSGRGDQAAGC
ncbi:hypothetical protein B0H11DRAFT_1730407, partial [Mycena galericulata]